MIETSLNLSFDDFHRKGLEFSLRYHISSQSGCPRTTSLALVGAPYRSKALETL